MMASSASVGAAKPKKRRKRKKGKKPLLSAADRAFNKIKADHRTIIRSTFRNAGFSRVTGVSDREFTYDNQKTDVDDIFIYENVVVIAEYTGAQSSGVGEHLKNKKHVYDKILQNPSSFLKFLLGRFPASAPQFPAAYHSQQIVLKVLYCSRFDFEDKYKTNVPGPIYMDYPAARYFAAVADAVRKSSRFELLHFMGIAPAKVGMNGKIEVGKGSKDYAGSLLPEAHSHFDEGFKIVTFYADPEALLRTAYVLRKDGWKDSQNLYQRMISRSKVEAIRTYLKTQRRVFINNIIVTLPADVKPLNNKFETINTSTLTETAAVTIKLPDKPNSIGIIDGQHRVFAYHESVNDDLQIAQLRKQQNLLVTGIIYPVGLTATEREKFEARLFIEINSNQTNAKTQLKQAIGVVLDPFSTESIATRVLSQLAKTGPLSGTIEQYFFDTNKLKTSSIVSYGLKPLVKASGNDSLFSMWTHPKKKEVADGNNDNALADYVNFCVTTINTVLGAIRTNLAKDRWTTDRQVAKRVLTTTYINSFLITARLLIEKQKSLEFEHLKKAFGGIDKFNFGAYHSSQYKRMAEKIVENHFGT
jgi:DGQHR domain-containing protein